MRPSVLVWLVVSIAVEVVALYGLGIFPTDSAEPLTAQTLMTLLAAPGPRVVALVVVVLIVVQAFQLGLFRSLKRAAHGEILSISEAGISAARRAIPCALTVFLINAIVLAVILICIKLHVGLATIPQYLTIFILFPAVYLVAARKRAILNALFDAIRWSRTPRYAFWLFGVQIATLALATAIWNFAPGGPATLAAIPFVETGTVLKFAALFGLYKFSRFVLLGTVFLAVDMDETERNETWRNPDHFGKKGRNGRA